MINNIIIWLINLFCTDEKNLENTKNDNKEKLFDDDSSSDDYFLMNL